MLSLRNCLFALVVAAAPASARSIHGAASAVPQTVQNAGQSSLAFLNIAHGIAGTSTGVGWPGGLNADGYPSGTLSTQIGDNDLALNPNYFGHYKIWWTGTGNFNINAPFIVYSGGSSVGGIFGPTGSVSFNLTIGTGSGVSTQPTLAAPVEFSTGALVSGIQTSTATAGLVELTGTLTTAFSSLVSGAIAQINNVTNLASGLYTINVIDSQHIELVGTTFNGTMAVVGGGPGPQSEVIFTGGNVSWAFLTGTFTNMDGAVLCRSQNTPVSDCTGIANGHHVNPDYVSLFKAPQLNPRLVRFMNFSGVTGNNLSTNFNFRPVTTNLSWGLTTQVLAYWGGTATNGGSDNYTLASNPTASPASGGFVDGEIVSGVISGANTGYNPKLGITGRTGTAPILDSSASELGLTMTGSVPPTATTISIVFTGGGLASPFTYHYLTSTSVAGPGGALDTSFVNIATNISADLNGNVRGNSGALVTAGIFSQTAGAFVGFKYNPNINSSGVAALGNGMTITGSDSASSATYHFGFLTPGVLANNELVSFTYSALAGGWITSPGSTINGGGPNGGPPLEFYEDFCLQANVGMWLNMPLLYSASSISSAVTHIANSGVKELALEISNETWNFGGGGNASIVQNLGMLIGLQYPGNESIYGNVGLRIAQMSAAARTAWANAGRNANQLFIVNAYQFVQPGATQPDQFNGTNLNPASNVTLAAYGGPYSNLTATPGASATNYSAAGNRPIDASDLVSPASYWQGGQFNSTFNFGLTLGVPLASYNCALVASYNFVHGNSTQQQTALDFLYSTSNQTGDLYNGTLNGAVDNAFQLASRAHGSGNSAADYFGITTIVASYDTFRTGAGKNVLGVAGYEGDFEGEPIDSTSTTTIANSLTALGDTSGYTSGLAGSSCGMTVVGGGPTSTVASDASNMFTLLTAFKNDDRFRALYAKYFSDFQTAINSQGARIALPATFGLDGPSDWSKYPGSIYSTPFKSLNAIIQKNN